MLQHFLPRHAAYTAEAWAASNDGIAMARLEQALLDNAIADIFGYYAIQLGDPHRDLLERSVINCKITAGRSGGCDVITHYASLPFENASVDLVVIAHALEFAAHPQHTIREVHRILRPEGHLILLCFNPTSLYGLRRLIDWQGEYPMYGKFLTPSRLQDWFAVLGFENQGGGYVGYGYPNASEKILSVLEKAGNRWWPMFGASVMQHVIKRSPAMRLIKPDWRKVNKRAKATAPVVKQDSMEI